MAAINTGKVIVGGLLAGVVMNVCDMFTNMVLFKEDMMAFVKKMGMDPAVMDSFASAVPWIIVDFVFGIILIWNYALVRPRLGPGPKTAMVSGLVVYLAVTSIMYGFTAMGLWEMGFFVKSSAVYLVTVMLASVAGAWAYKEE